MYTKLADVLRECDARRREGAERVHGTVPVPRTTDSGGPGGGSGSEVGTPNDDLPTHGKVTS